jgi:ethanolamine utilization protein EutQ (cupin superfamily)
MVIIDGRLSVSTDTGTDTLTAGPGEIVCMPKGERVTIRSHGEGAIAAYVTYPHWQDALASK